MICIDCVTPKQLKQLISVQGQNKNCSYCGNIRISIESETLFEYVLDRIIENIASETDLSPYESTMFFDCGADQIQAAHLDVVISEWMDIGEDPYYDALLKHTKDEFKKDDIGANCVYFMDDGTLERNNYEDKWELFIANIQHSHRFFNSYAKEFLDTVFISLIAKDNFLNPNCIRTICSGTPLYRARSAATFKAVQEISKDPATQLGPTPIEKAGNQRMTPNGISSIYCSLERETCLSEIRSITGDNVVSVAMTPTTQLALLDLTKLDQIDTPELTILDKGYLDAMHRKTFVSSLVTKMSKPKGRNDDLSYLATQIVFEYLRVRFSGQVDGLVFPSVQTGRLGTNVVLFPEASTVSSKNYPANDELAMIFQEPNVKLENDKKLAVVEDSIRFHKIKAIKTEAAEYSSISELFMTDLTRKRFSLTDE